MNVDITRKIPPGEAVLRTLYLGKSAASEMKGSCEMKNQEVSFMRAKFTVGAVVVAGHCSVVRAAAGGASRVCGGIRREQAGPFRRTPPSRKSNSSIPTAGSMST